MKLLSLLPSLFFLSPVPSLHRVLQNRVLSGVSAGHWAGPSGHGKRRAASAAAGCYLLCYRRRDAEIEPHGHCLLPVIKEPSSPCKISPSPATDPYPQILISSNSFFEVTHDFALEHLFSFSFQRKSLRNCMMSAEDLWVTYAPAYDIGTIIFSLQTFLRRYPSPWGL